MGDVALPLISASDAGHRPRRPWLRSLSIRARLVLLVLAILIPACAIGTVGIVLQYRARYSLIESNLLVTTQALSLVVDRELGRAEALISIIALSQDFQNGDVVNLSPQIRSILQRNGQWIVLVTPDGQQRVNTLLDDHTALPRHPLPDVVARVVATGQPEVSNVFRNVVNQEWSVGLHVPVMRDNKVVGVLMLGLRALSFAQIQQDQVVPAGWFSVIVDRSAHIVTRTPAPERFVGQPVTPWFLKSMREQRRGLAEVVNLEGIPALGAFSQTPVYGWTLAIAMPLTEVRAALRTSVIRGMIVGGGLLAASLILATLLAKNIVRPIAALENAAAIVGRGEVPPIQHSGLTEVDAVSQALHVATEARQRQEQGYRILSEAMPQLVWTFRPGVGVAFVNSQVVAYTGRTPADLLGHAWRDILHPDDVGRLNAARDRAIQDPNLVETEIRLRGADGTYRWFMHRSLPLIDQDGTLLQRIGTSTDITDIVEARKLLAENQIRMELLVEERTSALKAEVEARQKVEAELAQAQKMEAIGRLTGGIAHDFNNLLASIILNMDLLQDRFRYDADAMETIDAVRRAAEHGATLTSQMLAVGRRQFLRPSRLRLHEVVNGMSHLVRRAVGDAIDVRVEIPPGLWPLHADRSQLEAALLNLVLNAGHAMPHGGALVISARNDHVDEPNSVQPGIAAGDYVTIAISDTGVGMDADTAARAFEPFFTTRDVGQGSGLGLSQVYGFAQQSGGQASIDSMPGRGTTVTLRLPRAAAEAEPVPAQPAETPRPSGGGRTILIVEDRADLRNAVARALRGLDYRTILAEDGAAALAVLRGAEPIDLLFTDVSLPGTMNGIAVANQARQLRPGLKIIVTSGYPQFSQGGRTDGGYTFIAKPYRIAVVAARIGELVREDEQAG